MIRVMHLTTDSRISGAEKLLIGIAKEFDRSKYEVYFCTLKPRGPLNSEIEKIGPKAFTLNCLNAFDFLAAEVRLAWMIHTLKIDILHTHLYHAGVVGQLLAYFNPRVKGLLTRHYSDLLYLYGNSLQRFIDVSVSNLAGHVIAISEGVKKVMVEMDRVDPKKISVIYNGIDASGFTVLPNRQHYLRKEFGIPEHTTVIGSIGALHPRKGHRYLIEAASIVCRDRCDVVFIIVGDGVLKKELSNLAYALNLQDKVIFTGYRTDIPEILSDIDIVVQPSVEEGFGLSIIEAFALAKPVIATNVGGIPEIIDNGKTGILIPPRDPKILATAICDILKNPGLKNSLGANAQQVANTKFSLKRMVREYEKLYESIV